MSNLLPALVRKTMTRGSEPRPLTVPERYAELLREIDAAISRSHNTAKMFEFRVDACWWAGLAAGGAASLIGFLAAVPAVQSVWGIQPWWVSVLTLVSGALVIVRRRPGWREISDIFYAQEREMDQLRSRARYEMPEDITADQVALISREFVAIKNHFRLRMQAVNAMVDEADKMPHSTRVGRIESGEGRV